MSHTRSRRGLPRQIAEWYGTMALSFLLIAIVPFVLLVFGIGPAVPVATFGLCLGVAVLVFLGALITGSDRLYYVVHEA
jgi:hypothetical protein